MPERNKKGQYTKAKKATTEVIQKPVFKVLEVTGTELVLNTINETIDSLNILKAQVIHVNECLDKVSKLKLDITIK